MNQRDPLYFDDLQEYVTGRLGDEPWTTVYEYTEENNQKIGYYCALVRPDVVEQCFDNQSWDLLIGNGLPGFTSYPDGTQQYYRFGEGRDEGVEPLIICRDFHGLKPDYLEVSEEFRHFHNLYEDRKKRCFRCARRQR